MSQTQAEYLAWCRDEVTRSKRWRTQQKYDDDWRRYIDMYQGRQYAKKENTDQLVVNLIFSTINTMAPAVAVNNPKFVVSARRPEAAPQSVITEELLNYLWQTNQYQDEFRLAVLDWLITGHGWVKVGYKFSKPPVEKKVDGASSITPAYVAKDGAGGDDVGVDDRDDTPGNVETEVQNITADRPFVERISQFDMFVDPDSRHPKEMRWIAQRTWRPIADVKVDSRYESGPRKACSATGRSKWLEEGDMDGRGTDLPDKSKTFVEVIEFYDIKKQKVSTFSMDGEDNDQSNGFLIKPAKMPYAVGQPFVMLRGYEVPDCFYPLGDVCQIESLQLELNSTRTQMMNHRKRFARKWLYDVDAFDEIGIAALNSNADNVMVPVSKLNANEARLADIVVPMPAVITPSEFYEQSGTITMDIDRVSGVNEYQRGQAQANVKRTATEAAMIQDSANSRAQDRLAKIESVLSQIGERIIGLMQQYMTGEQTMRIVTMPGAAWVNYDPEYIKGEFDFSVAAGSTEPMNESFRRQSAMQMVDSMMPFMQQGVVNPYTLAMQVLQKGFGIKDTSSFIQQPAPPAPDPATGAPQPVQGGMPPGGPQPGPPGVPPAGAPAGPAGPMPAGPPQLQAV